MEALALSQSRQPRRLRVGIYADARRQPRWIVEALERVARSDFAEVVLVDAGRGAAPPQNLLWKVYGVLDRRLFGADPAERVDIAECFAHGAARELDVAFALGAFDDRQLDGMARHGVWRFCFGLEAADDAASAGAREVALEQPLTGSGLKVRLAAGAPPRLAYQTWSRTYPFSVARNREHLRKSGEFVLRALADLHRLGPSWLQSCRVLSAPPPSQPLSGAQALKIGTRLLRRGAEKALSVEQWFLAFSFNRAFQPAIDPGLRGFTRLMPPKDRDWADPFPVERDGRYYVFFEEVPFATRKGRIAMIEVDRAGRWSAPVPVLERDYHLSYPFLFEDDGRLYMIPETAEHGTVELWRCVDFPLQWRLEQVLLDGVRLVDVTLHRAGERWWMFANCAPGDSQLFDDELCLFSAERLTGPWQPHPRNPVKSDPRCSRPAGRLFVRHGELYRPAQICVPRYGAGVSIQRVVRLSTQEYAERPFERIVPGPASGLLGLHTMNHAGDLVVVDAFVRRRRL